MERLLLFRLFSLKRLNYGGLGKEVAGDLDDHLRAIEIGKKIDLVLNRKKWKNGVEPHYWQFQNPHS